jgi:hypothetical protein
VIPSRSAASFADNSRSTTDLFAFASATAENAASDQKNLWGQRLTETVQTRFVALNVQNLAKPNRVALAWDMVPCDSFQRFGTELTGLGIVG